MSEAQEPGLYPLMSASRKALIPALIKAQGEIPELIKDQTAKVRTKNGQEYSYNYADLAGIRRVIQPVLTKYELSLYFIPWQNDDVVYVQTVLEHTSGEYISNILWLPWVAIDGTKYTPHALGSAQTYLRRYGLTAVLGIAAGEDDDGELAESASRRGSDPKGQRSPAAGAQTQKEPRKEAPKNAPEASTVQVPSLEEVWKAVEEARKAGAEKGEVASVLRENKAVWSGGILKSMPEIFRAPAIEGLKQIGRKNAE